jgi:hypothetical protein
MLFHRVVVGDGCRLGAASLVLYQRRCPPGTTVGMPQSAVAGVTGEPALIASDLDAARELRAG